MRAIVVYCDGPEHAQVLADECYPILVPAFHAPRRVRIDRYRGRAQIPLQCEGKVGVCSFAAVVIGRSNSERVGLSWGLKRIVIARREANVVTAPYDCDDN